MIIALPSFIVIFFYLVFKNWKQEQEDYLKIAQDDFDVKLQELLLKRNLEK